MSAYQDFNSKPNMSEYEIRVAGFIKESIVDGPGIRFVVFCQGCPHSCIGCHNPQTHSFKEGNFVSVERIVKAIDENPLLQGVTFSGGEPLCQPKGLSVLGREIKARGLHLMIYTGYTMEELIERMETEPELEELLGVSDILVDGKFMIDKKNLSLSFRGSENQRIIDLKAFFDTGKIVTMESIAIN